MQIIFDDDIKNCVNRKTVQVIDEEAHENIFHVSTTEECSPKYSCFVIQSSCVLPKSRVI